MIPSHPPRTITVEHKTEKDGLEHTFLFRYHEDRHTEALQHLTIMAENPELPSFSWYDVSVVANEMNNKYEDLQNTPPPPINLLGVSFSRKS